MAKTLERPIGRRRLWATYFPDARGRMWGRVHGEGGEFPGVLARMHRGESKATLRSHSASLFNQSYLCWVLRCAWPRHSSPQPLASPQRGQSAVVGVKDDSRAFLWVESRLRDLAHWQGIWIYCDLRAEGFPSSPVGRRATGMQTSIDVGGIIETEFPFGRWAAVAYV